MKSLRMILGLLVLWPLQLHASVVLDNFLRQKEVTDIRELKCSPDFEKVVEVLIEQPLDHRRPEGPTFSQRVYISHTDPSRPVVLVTAGYDAGYYYTSEITTQLQCNQIMVEHRYFGRSRPDSIDWRYLDTWQASTDLHRIIQIFKELYPGQWISTGISKGGQTTIYHSFYYPEDVDVRVPYVAPLNYGIEDERIYAFLDDVGKSAERRKIRRFQKMVLKNQESYLPAFKEFSRKKGYTFDLVGGEERAFEYCVLEYDFAFWQWRYASVSQIPRWKAGPEEVIAHLNRVGGFDYFSDAFITEYRPFFYQALTETGYYGYDLEEFDRYLKHVENPRFTFAVPEKLSCSYNPELSGRVAKYLREEAGNFIYIYGECDTWTATGITDTGQTNSRIFVKKGGSHRTRISNMPDAQREEVYRTLLSFLE